MPKINSQFMWHIKSALIRYAAGAGSIGNPSHSAWNAGRCGSHPSDHRYRCRFYFPRPVTAVPAIAATIRVRCPNAPHPHPGEMAVRPNAYLLPLLGSDFQNRLLQIGGVQSGFFCRRWQLLRYYPSANVGAGWLPPRRRFLWLALWQSGCRRRLSKLRGISCSGAAGSPSLPRKIFTRASGYGRGGPSG
jgi:hypothetical protein